MSHAARGVLLITVVISVGLAAERPAFADLGGLAQESARAAVQRQRRSIALGPTVGIGAAWAPGLDEVDAPLTFGLAFRKFDIPWLPEPSDVKDLVIDRVLEGGDAKDMVKDVAGELVGRVTGRRPRPPKTLEKPKLAITVEGARLLDSGAWQVRAAVGFGISKVTIGPALSGTFGDADGLLLGGELAVHLTPWKGVRSPVVDVYLRGELGVTSQVGDGDLITLGGRFLLDLI
jgi:hypothetical protein